MKVGDCVRITEKGHKRMQEKWDPAHYEPGTYPPAGAVGYLRHADSVDEAAWVDTSRGGASSGSSADTTTTQP